MDMRPIGREAESNHGIFAMPFLERIGISRLQARRQVVAGRWRQIHEGVFTFVGLPPSFEAEATAALAALPHAVLAGPSASRVLDFGPTIDRIHVAVEHGTRHRLDGVVIRQTVLPSHHVTRRKGFRVTTVERTIVDLASVLSIDELQRCIEDQVLLRRTTLARIESTFAELSSRGRGGTARMRRVLAQLDPNPPSESELEASFLRLLRRNGLPLPQRQASFPWLGNGRGRVDCWYPGPKLIVELDGRRFHARSTAFEEDRKRDQLGLMQGIRTVRFTHRQLATERAFVADVVRTLLGQ